MTTHPTTHPHSGRDAHLTSPPLASLVPCTPSEGLAEPCSWCCAPSVVRVVDRSWVDYACQAHAIEWYPVEYRILVPPTSLVKWITSPRTVDPTTLEIRLLKTDASARLRNGNLAMLHLEFRFRGHGLSLCQ